MNTFIELTTMPHKPNFLSEVVHECCSPTKYQLDAIGFPDMNVDYDTMDMLVKDVMRTALYRSSNTNDGAYAELMQMSTETEIKETFNHIEKLITAELFESPIFFDDSKELI
jgi:hypothetical protein